MQSFVFKLLNIGKDVEAGGMAACLASHLLYPISIAKSLVNHHTGKLQCRCPRNQISVNESFQCSFFCLTNLIKFITLSVFLLDYPETDSVV